MIIVYRFVLVYLFFLEALPGNAQTGYAVIYRYDDIAFPVTFNGHKRYLPAIKDKLVFSDSLSLCYRITQGDPFKKKTIIGEKMLHHAMIYNAASNYYFSEVAWPAGKPKYLITDSLKKEQWTTYDDFKIIAGYRCRPAFHVNEKNDSTLVWFTDSIPKPFGPFMYLGFPGLVLEVYDQRYGQHLIATKIETGPYRVRMPEEGILISPEEFRKLKR